MSLSTADRIAVTEMIAGHILALDSGDAATWTSNYTEDAELVGVSGAKTRGQAAIGAMAEKSIASRQPDASGNPQPESRHFMMAPHIEGGADRCVARSYFQIVQSAPGGCKVAMAGVYIDECVKLDGRWRIERRTAQQTLGIHP